MEILNLPDGGVALCCGSPWGLGVYNYTTEDGTEDTMYGFPPKTMDPHKFSPDPEACTPEEYSAWEKAKKEWKEKNEA